MADENPQYAAEVRLMRCVARDLGPCSGKMEAHHAGHRPGYQMKAHDETCVPLCLLHHRNFHDHSGVFRGWKKAEKRAWTDEHIRVTQERLAHLRAPEGEAA